MIKYEAPSGAKVEITLSDFDTAFDLQTAIIKAIRQNGLVDIGVIDFANLAADWRPFAGMFMDIITSKEVKDMVFKCMERCTYNNEKIARDTFEKEERRGDFFEVALKVATENIRPFWNRLLSRLQAEASTGKKTSPASK